tara:strand:+ start:60 stop:248 length:189 start_codon:yes stop_codon:yes gene_type:complete
MANRNKKQRLRLKTKENRIVMKLKQESHYQQYISEKELMLNKQLSHAIPGKTIKQLSIDNRL